MPRVKLLASLKEITGGKDSIEVEADDWRDALKRLREEYAGFKEVIGEDGNPRPGYLVFIDGVDYRLYEGRKAKEIVILPVNHGGGVDVELVSWQDIDEMTDIISKRIIADGFNPDVIVGILRGGIIPARILADKINVDDIGVLEVKLYKSVGIRGERPYLRQPLILPVTGKRVLIVDDVSDSGLTLQFAVEVVNAYMPKEVKTATLYIKPWTDFIPDYYARSTESWVVFPWERGEFEREKE